MNQNMYTAIQHQNRFFYVFKTLQTPAEISL